MGGAGFPPQRDSFEGGAVRLMQMFQDSSLSFVFGFSPFETFLTDCLST